MIVQQKRVLIADDETHILNVLAIKLQNVEAKKREPFDRPFQQGVHIISRIQQREDPNGGEHGEAAREIGGHGYIGANGQAANGDAAIPCPGSCERAV